MFEPDNGHWAAGFLHRDTRHVWCAVLDERVGAWLSLNLDRDGLHLSFEALKGADLADHYRKQGCEVFEIETAPEDRALWPMVLNNCVGFTKAVLGLRTRAFTPHQLRRHLLRTRPKATFAGGLTLPGFGGKKAEPPPVPDEPVNPNDPNYTKLRAFRNRTVGTRGLAGTVRGGSKGLDLSNLQRALKRLTGE
jgi:hypothetical protein